MIESIQVSGKTEDDAIASALEQLGLSRDDVSIEIIERAKSGFLGIGASPAVIKVSYEKPDSQQEKVEKFLKGLLEHMDVDANIAFVESERGLGVNLTGDNMGVIIGRHGETLDAIQHLTNYATNRGVDKRTYISIDAENYRSKREDSLTHLAEKMAAKAIKYRRNMALEPMNSYERHVIHSALQDFEGVATSSTGMEPNRRVVVTYVRSEQKKNKPQVREWS